MGLYEKTQVVGKKKRGEGHSNEKNGKWEKKGGQGRGALNVSGNFFYRKGGRKSEDKEEST